ncbi:MAG: hypothetical protein WAM94_12640 [Chromatiaceae bacterium]
MITRVLLLLSLAWMMRLPEPLFTLMPELAAITGDAQLREALAVSGRDLILILAMAFSVAVEMLNIRSRRLRAEATARALPEPVHLRTTPHAATNETTGAS